MTPQDHPTARPWPPVCWVLTDGNPGTENQAVGLAEAMGLQPIVKRFKIRKLWRELGRNFEIVQRIAFRHHGITPPWPDLLISTGRTGATASAYARKESGGQTFTVQIQKPVVPPRCFDRVIVPEHDNLTGENIVRMIGAFHRVTPDLLRRESAKWAPSFAHLPQPYVTVLVGGSKSAVSPMRRLSSYRLGPEEITTIGAQLRQIAAEGAGLLVTTSRRTSAESIAQLKKELAGQNAVVWDGEGENPYYGMLGLADAFLATCDSVNMICEACSTGKPVHMIQLPGHSAKMEIFHASLISRGQLRPFTGKLERWSYEPLKEKERVAATIRDAYLGHEHH